VLRHIDHYVLKSSRGMDEPSTLRSGWYCCIRRDSRRNFTYSKVRRNFTYSSLLWYSNTSQISTLMVHPFPCCFLTHNGLYDATQYKCPKLHPYFSFNCRISFIPDDGSRISRNIE